MLASDLIGQLGDPLYPKKANALFAEFEELGAATGSSATATRPTSSTNIPSSFPNWSRRTSRRGCNICR